MIKPVDPTKTEKYNTDDHAGERREPSTLPLILFVLIYVIDYKLLTTAAMSQGSFTFAGNQIPVTAFAGVFSSICNIIIILMVVFLKKRGFVAALLILVLTFPRLLQGMFIAHSPASIAGLFSMLLSVVALIIINSRNGQIDRYQTGEIEHLVEKQQLSQRMFEQTATALVNAIDAKDTYSHGHSLRVAEYSKRIAEAMGKSEEECYRIYYSALLHDVGKIGIDDRIINKNGILTHDEYEVIKQHPVMGHQILSSIDEYPYLSVGAHFHHERYDGKGYPKGLKGEDIPEVARIISVADAYDAMSSNRSYRSAIPQQLVREEIIKGAGTQFDPRIATVMQHLIDADAEYRMKEWIAERERSGISDIKCEGFRSSISNGTLITAKSTRFHLKYRSIARTEAESRPPVIVLYDSIDGRVHTDSRSMLYMNYYEYCEAWFDGHITSDGIRKAESRIIDLDKASETVKPGYEKNYDVEAVKVRDHVFIKIDDGSKKVEFTIALPDSTRYAYVAFTGENCEISDINVSTSEEEVPDDYIERIAEEISFIDGPEGDVPNLQVDGHRTASTEGIPLTDGLKLAFHTKSLPTARLIWHCPYVDIFRSKDHKVKGEGYHEYVIMRIDGENIEADGGCEIISNVKRTDDFKGWDAWKQANKDGFDCTITFKREGNSINMITENNGLYLLGTCVVTDGGEDICVALTGDQCAITDIRIGS